MAGCGATCGIQRLRQRERDAAISAILRAHERASTSDPSPSGDAWDLERMARFGQRLEAILPVRVHLRAGGGLGCDALYLLVGLHAPSLLEAMDGARLGASALARVGRGDDRETYLRIAFSPIGRFVALQEVQVRASLVDETSIEIDESPCVGVEDRRLQEIVRGLQGELRKEHLVLLDMAFLVEPAPFGHAVGGEASTLWSFLFESAAAASRRIAMVTTS